MTAAIAFMRWRRVSGRSLLLGGLGEARRPLAASYDVAGGEGECHEGERALPGERGLLETDVCT